MRILFYIAYGFVITFVYGAAVLVPPEPSKEGTSVNATDPFTVRASRLKGVSRLDEATIASATHRWHRVFVGPGRPRSQPRPYSDSESGGGYYGGRYHGGGGFYGGGWFGGK